MNARGSKILTGLVLAVAAAGVIPIGGCSNLFNQHAQIMDAMRGIMGDTAARLSESGTGQIAAGGQVINPGLRVSGGVEYYAVAQYEGVSGQVTAAMHGGLDRVVPDSVQQRIDAIWRDSSLTASKRTQMIYDILDKWMSEQTGPVEPADDDTNAP